MTVPESSNTRFLKADHFVVDRAQETVFVNGDAVDLRGRNYAVLLILMENAPALVTKDQLLDAVWKDVPVTEGVLTTALKTIRKAIGEPASGTRYIETRYGRGYQFAAPIEAVDDPGMLVAGLEPDRPVETSPSARPRWQWVAGGLAGIVLIAAAALFWPSNSRQQNDQLQITYADELAVISPHLEREFLAAGLTNNALFASRYRLELQLIDGEGQAFLEQRLLDHASGQLIDSRAFPRDQLSDADLALRLAVENSNIFFCVEALQNEARSHGVETGFLTSGLVQLCRAMSFPDSAHDPIAVAQRLLNQSPDEPFFMAVFAMSVFEQPSRFLFGRSNAESAQLRAQAQELSRAAELASPDSDYIRLMALLARLDEMPIRDQLTALSDVNRTDRIGAYAMLRRAMLLRQVGRIDEAQYMSGRHLASWPYNQHATTLHALTAYTSEQLDRGRDAFASYLELYPGNASIETALLLQTLLYGPEEARTALIDRGLPDQFASVLPCFRIPDEAPLSDGQIEQLVATCNELDLVFSARQLARAGETGRALEILEQIDPASAGLAVIFYYPEFASVRETDRFADIAQAFGLIEVWRSSVLPDFCFAEPEAAVCVRASDG
ncbi:winged helix-turn-helix domain-containing protein [Hyphobacterium sp.]|uniref:transcriptional regulator n=1 Tax=Hyphobacterium sp. TaxID=2004662 RepID=UPI003BA8846B